MKRPHQERIGKELKPLILPSSEILSKTQAEVKKLIHLTDELMEMTKDFPDKLFPFTFQFTREKDEDRFYVYAPLFYIRNMSIHVSSQKGKWFRYGEDDTIHWADTVWDISLGIFSDEPTRAAFTQFAQKHPRKAQFADTYYGFDGKGNYGKVILVHKDFVIDRKPIRGFDSKLIKMYQSIMTAEDFKYAERALSVMKDRIEDYIKFGFHPQNATAK